MSKVHVIDLDSGNLQSIRNVVEYLGYEVYIVKRWDDPELKLANRLLLPGVGNFGHFLHNMRNSGFEEPIRAYIRSGKPIMGICVGLQAFFKSSEEAPGVDGLGLFDMSLTRFDDTSKPVPEIGWNTIKLTPQSFFGLDPSQSYYFDHSYAAIVAPEHDKERELQCKGWQFATTKYGDERFIAAIMKDNVFATQFHPEKSGKAGLRVIELFIKQEHPLPKVLEPHQTNFSSDYSNYGLTRRVIACLDVRTDDNGELVVTKGHQYDVREGSDVGTKGKVRNLGHPAALAQAYYDQGADAITFMNITSFRHSPLEDTGMIDVLKSAARTVFVPLVVGGGIKDTLDKETGEMIPALKIASKYFMSGADKVSIASDAVKASQRYYELGGLTDGKSSIEMISKAYGSQAVVVSIDPKRVYVNEPQDTVNKTIKTKYPNEQGQDWCWYMCTIDGGRKSTNIGVWEVLKACEALGAGEILLNCMDKDGTNSGYDIELLKLAKEAVKIPIIASSGAGKPDHFREAFIETTVDACLAAGMFHNGSYTVRDVKDHLSLNGLKVRVEQ
ncbi:HER040Cp [Eremothecium sinecaudum]|uniref:Imidazole glycerol phosphate synthase hisHF n=1 Tax=Eremothecium sinecaudum TaxID=45286 RepID=A0A0X8HTT1_9SACH|nr:HER040Cp [Eremothecium sinecaudum]AMD21319.1 HER040Cp [Eremothecium sinecaudum]